MSKFSWPQDCRCTATTNRGPLYGQQFCICEAAEKKKEGCTCLDVSKNSMCPVHGAFRDNKYRYKTDTQVLMMAIYELSKIVHYADNNIEDKELFDELSWRGRKVNKASKHWPNEEIERRDNV